MIKKIIYIFLMTIIIFSLSSCRTDYSMMSSLQDKERIKIEFKSFEDKPLVYISKHYKCDYKNNELFLYKDDLSYKNLNIVGNFKITELGHANIFEKNNEFIFLTEDDKKIYVNFYDELNNYSYYSLQRINDWNSVYLYVDEEIYLVTTDNKTSSVYIYDKTKNELNMIINIDFVVTECISFLYNYNEHFIIQDYSRRQENSYFLIDIPNGYYEENYFTNIDAIKLDTDINKFTRVENDILFYSDDIDFHEIGIRVYDYAQRYIFITRLFTSKEYLNFTYLKSENCKGKLIFEYKSNYGNFVGTFLVDDICYLAIYDNTIRKIKPNFTMLRIDENGNIQYDIIEEIELNEIYRYSKCIVLKNDKKTIYYEMK